MIACMAQRTRACGGSNRAHGARYGVTVREFGFVIFRSVRCAHNNPVANRIMCKAHTTMRRRVSSDFSTRA